MNECSPCLIIPDTNYKYNYQKTINQFYSNLAMNLEEHEEIPNLFGRENIVRQHKFHGRQNRTTKEDCPSILLENPINIFNASLI